MDTRPRFRSHSVPDARQATERLADFFSRRPPTGIASAYLYGSTLRGSPNRERDVDVAVLLDRSVHPTRRDRAHVRVDLAGALIGALDTPQVDLVVLNDAPPELGRAIIRDGRRIVCHDPELDHAFVRDVQLRAADLDPFLRRTRAVKLRALRR